MKEGSGVERVISSHHSDDDLRDQVQSQYEHVFQHQDRGDLNHIASIEREKTAVEREMITIGNTSLNQLRKHLGLPPFEVPEKNVHVIPVHEWPAQGKAGRFRLPVQAIVVRDELNPLRMGHTLFHELTHFHSYQAADVDATRAHDYRLGFVVVRRDTRENCLNPLNEGVTETITKQLFLPLVHHQLFSEAYQQFLHEREADPDARSSSGPLFTEDSFAADIRMTSSGREDLVVANFTYPDARKAFDILCRELSVTSPNPRTPEGVRTDFYRSYFTGDLISVAKMTDRRFGRGTFLAMSNIQEEKDFLAFVERLVQEN